jgi:hypothetical protein
VSKERRENIYAGDGEGERKRVTFSRISKELLTEANFP